MKTRNQATPMIEKSKLPTSSCASSINEAKALVRRCAEPRPAGDQVKAAVLRASRRLKLPFSRTKDIWYGDAQRIDAEEMDRLRWIAERAELSHAVTQVEALRNRMLASRSPTSHQIVTALTTALHALGSMQMDVGEASSHRIISL